MDYNGGHGVPRSMRTSGRSDDIYHDLEICGPCRLIPWTTILKDPTDTGMYWPEISTNWILSQKSTCRICDVFATVFEVQKLSWDRHYRLNRYIYPGFSQLATSALPTMGPSHETRMLCLQDSMGAYGTAPHLVVTNFEPRDASTEQRYSQTSNIDIDQVKAWINDCDTRHYSDCAGNMIGELQQLRVIDCYQGIVVPAPVGCCYVALSYVWGQHRSEPDELQNPPKTIADSIYLTQKLGYNYLWIDRYCINQSDRTDKHTQVMQMGDIYAAAQITLVAAAGIDPSFGLPGVLSTARLVPKARRVGDVWVKPLPRLVQLAEVSESKWASRAWTFQEFHRSRRRLIFTEHQTIFVCNSGMRYEIALSSISWVPKIREREQDTYWAQQWLPQCVMTRDSRLDETMIDQAAGYLEAYSNRDLSYDTDALDAIAGALAPLRRENAHHVHGVPFSYTFEGPSNCASALPAKLPGIRPHTEIPFSAVTSSGQAITPSRERDIRGPSYSLPETDRTLSQSRISKTKRHIKVAFSWYHDHIYRRRPGFPSWSSLGWAGPIKWHREHANGKPSVILTDACQAILHSPNSTSRISDHNLGQGYGIDTEPPILELKMETVRLYLCYSGDTSRVAIQIGSDYKYMFEVSWDANPDLYKSQRLVGALISHIEHELLLMVLTTHGELYERVGIVRFPSPRFGLNHQADIRRHNFDRLNSHSELLTATDLCYDWRGHLSISQRLWKSAVTDYRSIFIR